LLALSDQGLFAGTNFIINMALARQLGSDTYGAYVLATTVFAFLSSLYGAALTEPLMVFGAGKYAGRFHSYLGTLTYGHFAISIGLIAASATAGVAFSLFKLKLLSAVCVGLAIMSPTNLAFGLFRRATFVVGKPGLAARAGVAYLITSLVLVASVRLLTSPSLLWGFAVSSVGCIPSVLWLGKKLDVRFIRITDTLIGEVATLHWNYSRWSLRSCLFRWIPTNALPWMLAAYVGVSGTATLRALLNPVIPLLQALNSLAGLLVPSFVRSGNSGELKGTLLLNGAFLVAASSFYAAFLAAFRHPLMHWIYAGRYDASSGLLAIIAVVAVLEAFIQILTAAFQSINAPRYVFYAYIASSTVTILAGFPLVKWLGLTGACYGLLLSYLASSLSLAALWKMNTQPRPEERTAWA
jgi:O-antigen/teichoic acid export membrane protein